jgi:hypothetical protein
MTGIVGGLHEEGAPRRFWQQKKVLSASPLVRVTRTRRAISASRSGGSAAAKWSTDVATAQTVTEEIGDDDDSSEPPQVASHSP